MLSIVATYNIMKIIVVQMNVRYNGLNETQEININNLSES